MDIKTRSIERSVESDPSLWRELANAKKREGDEAGYNLANARALTHERGAIEIVDIRPAWADKWDNCPGIQTLLNRRPESDEYIYTQHGSLYYAEVGPMCSYFSYTSPGRGYGGSKFKILLSDGTFKDLIGPWSSGSYAMNANGFGPCIESSVTADVGVWNRGYTYYGGSVRVDAVIPLLEKKGLGLILMESDTYQPTSRKKYPTCGPYYNKSALKTFTGTFHTVKKEILAAND